MSVLGETVNDGWVVTKRNLLKIKRIPDLLIFSTIQPIMFVLLFAYVFGGAIATPGVNYREFLMPGIFVQTVAFGAGITAIGLADDLQKGIVDRFRSLPMSRAAVLLGRTTSDLLNNVFVVAVMAITGLIVGWRIHEGFLRGVAGFLILFLFGYAMSWISAVIGLSVKSVEVAQSAGLIWMFPLTFLSNAFVPTDTLPSVLQPVAEWNPISSVVLALRELWGNAPSGAANGSGFPAEHPIELAVGWCLLILVIFMPWAIARYRQRRLPLTGRRGRGRRRRPAGVTAPAAAGQARVGAGAAPRRRPKARAWVRCRPGVSRPGPGAGGSRRRCAAPPPLGRARGALGGCCPRAVGAGQARAGERAVLPSRTARGVRWTAVVRVLFGRGRRARGNAPCRVVVEAEGRGRLRALPCVWCDARGPAACAGRVRGCAWLGVRRWLDAEAPPRHVRAGAPLVAVRRGLRVTTGAAARGAASAAGCLPRRGGGGRRWLVATGPTTARAGPMWSVGGAACAFVGCRWGTRA